MWMPEQKRSIKRAIGIKFKQILTNFEDLYSRTSEWTVIQTDSTHC